MEDVDDRAQRCRPLFDLGETRAEQMARARQRRRLDADGLNPPGSMPGKAPAFDRQNLCMPPSSATETRIRRNRKKLGLNPMKDIVFKR